jgi:hypothetical protein
MGIINDIRSAMSTRTRLLRRLAAIAGESERLAITLKQHTEVCDTPALRPGLESAAAAEAADAQALRSLLLAHDLWPTRPTTQESVGANYWARISADLAAEIELVRSLTAAVAEWEGVDREIAEQLRHLALRKDQTLGLLRDLALRCDPQALD